MTAYVAFLYRDEVVQAQNRSHVPSPGDYVTIADEYYTVHHRVWILDSSTDHCLVHLRKVDPPHVPKVGS